MDIQTERRTVRYFSPGGIFALGLVIPGMILMIAYIAIGIWPFGTNIILEVDSVHQYLPFLTELRRRLVSGESLLYSFSGGSGYNLWANVAYYAASPLNYLMVLIPESAVCDFLCWLILVKLSLCGGILSWYLYKREEGSAVIAVAFGTMYALSNYFLGYKFNLMWLDSISMVPLIMYGIENIVRGKGSGAYIFSLLYAIWCNYYIGYMICIFSCLYLLVQLAVTGKMTWKTRIRRIAEFTVCSLAGGGMTAVLLLPAYYALRITGSGIEGKTPGVVFYNNGLRMLCSHYENSMAFRTSGERGDVQIYCGVIVLLLTALYIVNRGISRRRRIAYSAFLGFILLSFTFSPLNYFWHGFHLENNLPNRFAFVYLAVLMKVCYCSICHLKELSWKRFILTAGAVVAFSAGLAADQAQQMDENRMFLSLLLLLLYAALLCILRMKAGWQHKAALLLSGILVTEAAGHGLYDLIMKGAYDKTYYVNYQRDYQALIDGTGDEEFFRSEIDSRAICNFITFAGGNGIALFDSTMQHSIRSFFDSLGVFTSLNSVSNQGLTKLMYDVFGVRYLASAKVTGDTWNGFTKTASQNQVNLYYNKEALSVGFMVSDDILKWNPESADGMEAQNQFAELACGVKNLFETQLEFSARSDVDYQFDIPDGGMLYVKLEGDLEQIDWRTSEFSSSYDNNLDFLLSASSTGKDQKAYLKAATKDGERYAGTSWLCTAENYQRVIETLSENQLENVNVSENLVSGDITVRQDGILLLTIPYDEGWVLTVDGVPCDIRLIGGALMGVSLSEGEHEIRLVFIPQGYHVGMVLSLSAALLTAAILYFEYCSRKRRRLV